MKDKQCAPGPDLRQGVSLRDLAEGGMIAGHVDGEEVILVRADSRVFAVGANCPHYHGPLSAGLVADGNVRCPLHHACFDLRTGRALRGPALDAIPCWRVEQVGNTAFVRERLAPAQSLPNSTRRQQSVPSSVLIVGGGGAGLAAASTLRRDGYTGPVTMISADASPPCDRPNLSKDYLAGTAPEDWIPLRTADFYPNNEIRLVLGNRVAAIDVRNRIAVLEDGGRLEFEALLLATGAEPVRLEISGAEPSQMMYLRTLADSKAIIAKAAASRSALIIGASFIGLEVAASLRQRGIDVHVVGQEATPLERVLGAELGRFVQGIHESHGVHFHLGTTVDRIEGRRVSLNDGKSVDAEFVVVGVGVKPAVSLAQAAGLEIDRGIAVDAYLETTASGIFAAGDVARWPDPRTGERIRVEHWVLAMRQGQAAARNMLGRREKFDAVPFFWSQHYEIAINYVGHAEHWDRIEFDGSLQGRDCSVHYKSKGRTLAVATINRDLQCLRAELALEKAEAAGRERSRATGT